VSRSRRKTPITGITTAKSDHRWKKAASRKLRRRDRQRLKSTLDGDSFAGTRWNLVNPWSSDKDGKWYHAPPSRWIRK
jgi:hypothetical protein